MSFFLIRHATPEIDTTLPASEWRLSHQGKNDARSFAKNNLPKEINLLISSYEPKAIETAQIMARERTITASIAAGLQEHARENVPYFPDPNSIERHIKNLFAQPDKCVFGSESANQALERLEMAISNILMNNPKQIIGFVTHGTVMSLLVNKINNLDGFHFWQTLSLPDIVKIDKNLFSKNI